MSQHGRGSLAPSGVSGPLAWYAALIGLSWSAVALSGCTRNRVPSANTAHAARALTATTPASGAPAWRYSVSLVSGRDLSVDATFAAAAADTFSLDDGAARFVEQVQFAHGADFVPVAAQGSAWHIPCRAGCRVRYRFALRAAAAALNDIDTAIASGDALIAPPSSWLLHPTAAAPGTRLVFQVKPGPSAHFASGFARSADGLVDSYVLPADALDDSSFSAFGGLQVADVAAGDTTIRLAIAPHDLQLSEAEAEAWISASAGAVASYYGGHLPARHALIVLMKGSGRSTQGETLGGGGPSVIVRASDEVTASTTRDDWVVTHELLHVNFPDLGREHAWLSEGLATYVEPVARARVGLVSEQKFWQDLAEGLPQGLPEAGDEGLENTHTWGRTYWGGALFCLMVDVTLRERTHNLHSLDDVLRDIAKTGVVDDVHWNIGQFLAAGQKATGTPIVSELYEQLALKPGTVNLPDLFARLGVRAEQGTVHFDDRAPLAQIRASITASGSD